MLRMTDAAANRVLAALPAAQRKVLTSQLRPERLQPWHVLRPENAPMERVYFPASGIISIVAAMEDGSIAEAYTVGRDGVHGAELLLGEERLALRSMIQVPGDFYWMEAAPYLDLVRSDAIIAATVRRYLHHLLTFAGQSGACNLVHDLATRCARWLLLVQDRAGADEFELTHDILATMLGVHRPAVTLAAGTLQKAGLIRYSHGRIAIVDRANLERASCECYRIVADDLDRALPPYAA